MPEELFVFEEDDGPLSEIPIVGPKHLDDSRAFAGFNLSPWSAVASSADPVLSHKDHNKFYLCQSLFNDIVGRVAGHLVHEGGDTINKLLASAIRGQRALFDFGFQSTHSAFQRILSVNARLIDGRKDFEKPGRMFSSPKERYRQVSGQSDVVNELKGEVLQLFEAVSRVSTNYRLAKLLNVFKVHCKAFEDSTATDGKGELRFFQGLDEGRLHAAFEELFEGEVDDAAKLSVVTISGKADLSMGIIDCMMYEDDKLFTTALQMILKIFSTRESLLHSLLPVELLETSVVPVFGTVQKLRTELTDLAYLAATTSVLLDLRVPNFGGR